ncbi:MULTISPECIES: carbohydrate ABC transporter permease [unclassified Streptomyces]|jgi:putative aldouronate transport system permease protein|uniref:carbohydrate ABC transporter permease n=1 Tax=Streptomyces TaxID=1883 RepID=UPI0029A0CB22|nr:MULTISPECIES: carbohydrate ABC transporter permease [unclassified Streptomyces]MDX2682602.1 carbohydrate ABC transporter permease [Streptomyces sp. NY05-11A]MDX3241266.1 carbohydrate ABC transporter permease [Streptomyces sp. ME18-1-4]
MSQTLTHTQNRPALRPDRNKGRPVWDEKPGAAGQTLKGGVLLLVLAVVLVPLWIVVLTSFSTSGAINRAGGLVLVPDGLTLDAYRAVLGDGPVTRAVLVSLVITAVGTLLSMVVSVLCAYGLSRSRSFGHRTILMVLIVTMFVSGGLIPTYLVVTGLGGYGQYWALILPGAVSVFNILVLRAFYSGTAADLIDAARMDGCSQWRILWSVVLPTSRAVTAVIALFYAVGYWNSFFNVMLYMPTESAKWPLQYVLLQYVSYGQSIPGTTNSGFGSLHQQSAPLSLQMAVVVLTLVPILLVYPFMQKHFKTGVLTGAVKG